MSAILLLFFFCFFRKLPSGFGALQVGFYGSSCPKAESIIQQVVQRRLSGDRSLAAALLRLQFHDCFVRGCDASLLIDSRNGSRSEKGAFDSLFLRGFDVIDEIKESLEAECPSTVSCADIIALVARDAVGLAGGPKYDVPTGRRDGLVSNVADVKLPQPDFPMRRALLSFTDVGLTLTDMITLLGAHTLGVAHCGFFEDRLQPGPGNQPADDHPPMDPVLKAKLAKFCFNDDDRTAFMDQNTPFVFDNSFYKQLLRRRGILELDERLAFDNSTRALVSRYAADNEEFLQNFARAMVKMGSIQVLDGERGEIRKNCRVFNNPK
ncbi:peroxidase 44-like [Prosopis cineraria]|uniref:peroxidase 44-like n=1 Tax=Prosopis cineraria TaxID=364024 RepID=UPI00240EB02E|nr:peroxidase 44-like [Prosopis cineraria]